MEAYTDFSRLFGNRFVLGGRLILSFTVKELVEACRFNYFYLLCVRHLVKIQSRAETEQRLIRHIISPQIRIHRVQA